MRKSMLQRQSSMVKGFIILTMSEEEVMSWLKE